MDVYCTLLTRRQIRVCFEFFMTPSWSPKQLLWYYSLCKVWLFTLLLPSVCHFNNRQCLFYMCTLKCDTQHKGASIYKLGFLGMCAIQQKKISLASHLDELSRLVFSYQTANGKKTCYQPDLVYAGTFAWLGVAFPYSISTLTLH